MTGGGRRGWAPLALGLLLLALLPAGAGTPRRVVSLVPSATECVAALGAQSLLVGRSRYCVHPSSVKALPQVGGYLDPSWEAIAGLRPDLLLLTPESVAHAERARSLGIPVLLLAQNHLEEVLAGIGVLGRALGREGRARQLEDSLRQGLKALRRRAASRKGAAPRVLLVADRPPVPGPPRDLWVIGQGSWLSELLEAMGARNAVRELSVSQALLSREGLAALDPDWIVELWPGPPAGRTLQALQGDWRAFAELDAVRLGRVRSLGRDELLLPGPRLLQAARVLEDLLFLAPARRPSLRPGARAHRGG